MPIFHIIGDNIGLFLFLQSYAYFLILSEPRILCGRGVKMEIEVFDELGNKLKLSYEIAEERGFYGVSVTLNDSEHAGVTFLTDRAEAETIRDLMCRCAVTPSGFFDAIRDYTS